MTITKERLLGRAKNALLEFFEKRTSVPKIYIDAEWGGTHIDVLSIDRDGVGDVHAVLLFLRPRTLDGKLNLEEERQKVNDLLEHFVSIPANYKYVAAVDGNPGHWSDRFQVLDEFLAGKLFSPDQIGRVGILEVVLPNDDEAHTNYGLKAERFRATVAKLADEYVQHHEADWEIRA